MQTARRYEFGDSITHTDVPATFTNALPRAGPGLPVRLKAEGIVTHRTRNTPRCASAVLLDRGGSMPYDEQHVNAKRMGPALGGLVRSECPGDSLQLIEMCTLARPPHASEVAALMHKPVTLLAPRVRKKVNRSDPKVSGVMVPPHFTNTWHGLQLARQSPAAQDTPNRQVMLITDGPLRGWVARPALAALPARPAHRERHPARGAAVRPPAVRSVASGALAALTDGSPHCL
jgi:uncharacterized protein with von Willebrand factor type A (vWA) domain